MALRLNQLHDNLSHADALKLSQQAPTILRQNPKAISTAPFASLFSATETADLWTIYENLLLSCLRTGDDQAAHQCLERLVLRFGDHNERILALKGLVKEATAENYEGVEAVLAEYDVLLQENPSNVPVAKRKAALLRSIDKTPDAISFLKRVLEVTPTDAEAWSELADMYLSQGIYAQAIFALEEVLVLVPNAWNMHARLGEVLLMANEAQDDGSRQHLAEALKRFCRSVELCDDYLRGYYGLKRVTDRILGDGWNSKERADDSFALPDRQVTETLNQVATSKLAEIVRKNTADERLWQGYSVDEIHATRGLLEKSRTKTAR